MKKIYLLFTLFCLNFIYAQSPTCDTASAFCAGGSTLTFGNSTNVPNIGGIDCLGSAPNPAWFYMTISQSGNLSFLLTQGNNAPAYNNLDVDFVVWGPFNSPNCTNLYDYPVGNTAIPDNVVDCSYSGSATENVDIPGAIAGQVYMVLITNFSNQPGQITLTQTNLGNPGAGATDCNVVCGVNLGLDQIFCSSSTTCYTINAIFNSPTTQPGTPVFTWFLDGVLQPTLTTQSVTVCQSGVWSVLATRPGCSAPSSDEVLITFSVPPVLNTPPDLTGPPGDCNPEFDLTSVIANLLSPLNPADYNVTFHEDLFDSFVGTNPILNPVTYTTSVSMPIYIRVENLNNVDCFSFDEFNLIVDCVASPTTPPDMIVCDVNNSPDGVEIFDLTSQDAAIYGSVDPTEFSITYHTTLIGAQTNNSTDLAIPAAAYVGGPNQVIYVRFESNVDTTVFDTTTFSLIVNPLPTAAIGTTAVCSGETGAFTISGTPDATVEFLDNLGATRTIVLNSSGSATVTTPVLTSDATYTLVQVTSLDGCTRTVSGTATVTVNPLPTVSISTSTASICSGTSATIDFVGTPDATITYTIDGVSNTIVLDGTGNASVTANTTSTYCLVSAASNSLPICNASFSDCVTITVIPLPTASITGDTICDGDTATVSFNGTPNASVNYTIDGVAQTPVTLSPTGTASVSATIAGTFCLVDVTTNTTPGCTQTLTQCEDVVVLLAPVANPVTDIRVCDDNNDCFATFDLSTAITEAQGGDPTLVVTIHETQADADFDSNPVSSPYQNIDPCTQVLYIRVENTGGCYTVIPFNVIVDARPALNQNVTDYELCDVNASPDGIEEFDLTNVALTTDITNGVAGLILTYYENQADAVANTTANAITTPATYSNSTPNQQTIWVTAENTAGCRHITSFELIVNPLPVLTPLAPMNGCSDGVNPNQAPFNLTLNDPLVTGGQPGFVVSYHLNQVDADNEANAIVSSAATPYVGTDGQIVFVRVENATTGCYDTTTLQLNVTQGPVANTPTALTYCDPNNDGFGVFTLQDALNDISGGPTPAGVTVTFHETPEDAQFGTNSITDVPYNNIVANQQTIYVSVSYALTGCANYTELQLIVNPTPDIVSPAEPLQECDDVVADGLTQFDLTQVETEVLNGIDPTTVTVSYHLTQAEADAGTPNIANVLNYTNTSNPQTIYIRVEYNATGCYSVESFDLVVNPLPIMPVPEDITMSLCDENNPGDQTECFDLNSQIPIITNGQTNMIVTFHFSQADAIAGVSPLPSPYCNTSNAQSIFVRLENGATGCFDTVIMDLRVEPLPVLVVPPPVEECGANQDGFAIFDLTALETDMLNGATGITLSYYETDVDAQNQTNPITTTSAYQNIDPFNQIIYVLAVNDLTGCSTIEMIQLIAHPAPIMPTLNDLVICDTNYDGYAYFDLTQQNPIITAANTITPLQIRYYTTALDAANGTAAIVNTANFYGGPFQQTIWAVVIDPATDCSATTTFDLIINVPVDVRGQNNRLTLCDEALPNDQFTTFNLTIMDAQILGTNTGTVIYYPSVAEAQAGTNPITDPTTYVNAIAAVQTLGVVVTSAEGCNSITTLTIRVEPLPTPRTDPPALITCDDDQAIIGTEIFDLTTNQAYIEDGYPNLTFEYYPTLADADAGTSEILNPTAYEGSGIIYIKVMNNRVDFFGENCYQIVEQELIVNPLPVVVDTTYVICDDDTDGFATFDLSSYNDQLLSPQVTADFTVTYYDTQANAQAGTATGLLPNTYTNNTNPEFVYPRVVDNATGCVNALAEVTLMVKLRAIANPISQAIIDTFTKCDYFNDNDGVEQFDLLAVEADILGAQTSPPITITYHLTPQDQATGDNPIANTTSYENTSNPQIIYIRVERANDDPLDTTAECYDVAEITLNVELLAEPVITSDTGFEIICVDFNTGNLISGLTLDSGIPAGSGYTYQWALNGADITDGTGEDATYTVGSVAPGIYTVVVTSTSPQGCVSVITDDSTFEVIQSGPAANIQSFISGSFEENQTITITNDGYGTYVYQLDGEGPWQSSPLFTNVPAGDHFVTVRDITNPDYSCGDVIIDDVSIINYPHFFTPNGDGINDYWNITGLSSQKDAKIYIFDRYGKLLKQISSTSDGWNGTFNGQPLPATDYWFTVDYYEITIDGTLVPKQFKAHFSLKR